MKFSRVLTLAVAGIMLALCLASCGAVAPEINVTVKIVAGEETILDAVVPIQSNEPTVLEAFQEACIVNEIDYVLTEDGASVLDIEEYKDLSAEASGDGLVYYWMYLLNDQEPKSGKANTNLIADGDVITYQYDSFDPEDVK